MLTVSSAGYATHFCGERDCNALFGPASGRRGRELDECTYCGGRLNVVPGRASPSPPTAPVEGQSPARSLLPGAHARRARTPPSFLETAWPAGSDVHEFLLKLWRHCDATDAELQTLSNICAHYTRRGAVERGDVRPLHDHCEACDACWHQARDRVPKRDEAGVSAPYIGPRYLDARTVVLATNFNSYGGLGAQWWICRGRIEAMQAGRRPRFHYGVGAYVAALQASGSNREPTRSRPTPQEAANAWLGVAFAELVKCSPRGQRSKPTRAMPRQCPPRYARAEVELLEPDVVLLVGRERLSEFTAMFEFDMETRGTVSRGVLSVGGREATVVCCAHTSRPVNWYPSYDDLVDSLRDEPLGAPR